MMTEQQMPIACDLTALPNKTEHEDIGRSLLPQAQSLAHLPHGYQVEFPITALELVARFVDGEHLCCPFLQFEILVMPAAQVLQLRLTGQAGVKAFLEQELLPNLPAKLV